jgi:hypothetical protein
MRKAGTPPQIVYAYKRTRGPLLTEDVREYWLDRVKEWDAAQREDINVPLVQGFGCRAHATALVTSTTGRRVAT